MNALPLPLLPSLINIPGISLTMGALRPLLLKGSCHWPAWTAMTWYTLRTTGKPWSRHGREEGAAWIFAGKFFKLFLGVRGLGGTTWALSYRVLGPTQCKGQQNICYFVKALRCGEGNKCGLERFEISKSCKKNIWDLACTTLLSTSLSSYSEEHPKSLTMVHSFAVTSNKLIH